MKTFDSMSSERLLELIEKFERLRVAVVGDFFLDKYLDINPTLAEVSIETGKTAHQVTAIRHSPGAAGTIVCNLSTLGVGDLHAIGFTGDDGEAYDLRKGLKALRCDTEHLHVEPNRMTPTYLKPIDTSRSGLDAEHERYDTKNRTPTPDDVRAKIVESLDTLLPKLDAVIVLDQVEEDDCGVVTTDLRDVLASRASDYRDVVFWADSRLRIREFRNVAVKPNQFEAIGRPNPPPGEIVELDELGRAIERMRVENGAPVVVTRGADGMIVSDPKLTIVPGVRIEGPIDPTGAGDSATAGTVLALAAGAELAEAALVGNLVASITVQQLTTTGTARPVQVIERFQQWSEQRGKNL